MTIIRPHFATLDGRPANPRRQRDRTPVSFWPTGQDGDTLYQHLQASTPVTADAEAQNQPQGG